MVGFLMKQGIMPTHENLSLKIVTNVKATIILAIILADKETILFSACGGSKLW